jgi:hypothetical protein
LTKFRGDDSKVMKSLKRVIDVIHTLSTSTILGEGIGLVRLARFWGTPIPLYPLYSCSPLQRHYSPVSLSYLAYVFPTS